MKNRKLLKYVKILTVLSIVACSCQSSNSSSGDSIVEKFVVKPFNSWEMSEETSGNLAVSCDCDSRESLTANNTFQQVSFVNNKTDKTIEISYDASLDDAGIIRYLNRDIV